MNEIFSQLGQLFVQTIPTVVFVFILLILLQRLFFGPLTRVMKQREEETVGALAHAREKSATAELKTQEYETAFQEARQAVYRQRELDRRAALAEREAAIRQAKEESRVLLEKALSTLETEVAAAKRELETRSSSLASAIAETVLGEPVSSDRRGGSSA